MNGLMLMYANWMNIEAKYRLLLSSGNDCGLRYRSMNTT